MPAEPCSREHCLALDAADPLAAFGKRFVLPPGLIYLDGNSLGPLPRTVAARVAEVITQEWGRDLITSWTGNGWFDLARRTGDRIARLIGAPAGSVVAGDTISINLFKVLGAALALRPQRRVILSDTGNFPSDLYVAQGLAAMKGGIELRVVAPDAVLEGIGEDIACVMLTEVDYRTSRLHDMAEINAAARRHGCLTVWDLAHSAGALPVDLAGTGADFAVGCTYKYLNGGPGSPGFTFVSPSLHGARSPLSGWWAHQAPFAFDLDFVAADGIAGFQCGTQSILALAALDEALKAWEGVELAALRQKSVAQCRLFAMLVEDACAGHGVTLAGPRDFDRRGSHVSFHCPEGYAVMQALIARGVIGDFRAPDMIRFGIAPLYIRYVDVFDAAAILAEIMAERAWDRPEYRARRAVT
jgi:kynureninase